MHCRLRNGKARVGGVDDIHVVQGSKEPISGSSSASDLRVDYPLL